MKIKVGDTVVVIAGKDTKAVNKKGVLENATGKVLKVYPIKNKVLVEGINKYTKHQKPSQQDADGRIIVRETPIHASNVMILDPKTKTPTRVGYKMEDGKKVRYAKKSGTVLDK